MRCLDFIKPCLSARKIAVGGELCQAPLKVFFHVLRYILCNRAFLPRDQEAKNRNQFAQKAHLSLAPFLSLRRCVEDLNLDLSRGIPLSEAYYCKWPKHEFQTGQAELLAAKRRAI